MGFKKNWVSLLAFFAVFFVSFKIELAKVNTVIFSQSDKINKTLKRVEKISDGIYAFKDDINSLNDKFQIFIGLCNNLLTFK